MNSKELMEFALGKRKVNLVLKDARIVNVFTKTIEKNDIAIHDGLIIGIGKYDGEFTVDCEGYYVSPGFIDGHCHIESSMLTPASYAKAVMPHGTTSVVADCHEIANVCGIKGIDFMLDSASKSPLDVFMMIPSCVPSTRFETSGAKIDADDIEKYKNHKNVIGLGEMMNYPGVLEGDEEVHAKLDVMRDKIIDGHAPSITDKELNAYVLSGIQTDHECVEPEEMIEKVKRGMYVHLREGSQTKNVLDLLPGVNDNCIDRLLFCSDDLHPKDIMEFGHINNNINLASQKGLDPISAIQMATINIANCYNLKHYGAIAPGYVADMVVFKDLKDIQPHMVFKKGKLVARDNEIMFDSEEADYKDVTNTVHINKDKIDLDFPLRSNKVNIIGLIDNNVTTHKLVEEVKLEDGKFYSRNNPEILKLVVIERHHHTGNIGKALVKGYGLKNAAIALTIAHDSHNLIVVGDNDRDMRKAIEHIDEIQGGIVLTSNGEVVDSLELKIGGLMSIDKPEHVRDKLTDLENAARKLGVLDAIDDPFLALGFLSLPVIPDLKCTDLGLFDVNNFKIIPIEADDIT